MCLRARLKGQIKAFDLSISVPFADWDLNPVLFPSFILLVILIYLLECKYGK